MRPGRAADHSPPSSAAVMEEWSYTSTHPLGHTGPITGSLYLYLFLFKLSCPFSHFTKPCQLTKLNDIHRRNLGKVNKTVTPIASTRECGVEGDVFE